MRTPVNAATALLLTALMLTSLFAIQQHNPVEVLPEDDLSFDEPLLTSGRSASTSLLAAGSPVQEMSDGGDHIESSCLMEAGLSALSSIEQLLNLRVQKPSRQALLMPHVIG